MMQPMMIRKKVILPALFLASLLVMPVSASAQKANDFPGRAGAMADRLNPALQNFHSEKDKGERFKRLLAYDNMGGEHRLVIDMWRRLGLLIRFKPGSYKILPRAKRLLMDLGGALEELNESNNQFLLAGHTDISGDAISNKRLSERRARAVRDYILQNFNINPHRLLIAGFGESAPYDVKNPESAKNRRVEVVLVHKTTKGQAPFVSDNRILRHNNQAASSNVVCKSYQGVTLRDIRPPHMEMDDYDARIPALCTTSMKAQAKRR